MATFVGKQNVDKLEELADIATDLDFIVGATAGDKPTGICRHLRSSLNS